LTPKDLVSADQRNEVFLFGVSEWRKIMKSVSVGVVALGLLLAMAAPSLAHGYWAPGYHYHHGYSGPYYYRGGYSPVVVVPAPVYGYPTYPPVVTPAAPLVVTPVVPSPYYYGYGAPGVTFGYRSPRVGIGVAF
jgi:hypothetical protein